MKIEQYLSRSQRITVDDLFLKDIEHAKVEFAVDAVLGHFYWINSEMLDRVFLFLFQA